ncbi:flagellar protein FlaG [Paradesulfitobacterium aromaticivorans]
MSKIIPPGGLPQNQMWGFDPFPQQKLDSASEISRPKVISKEEVPSAREEVPREEVEKATEKMNRLMGIIDKRWEFSVHERSHRIMVKVLNRDSGEVIEEIPSKRILDMLASFTEMTGVFLDKYL